MLRRLLNVLIVLSLLLCVAVVALWARSYFATDTVRMTGEWVGRAVLTRGEVVIGTDHEDWAGWEVSVALDTGDRPRDPEYSRDRGLWSETEAADEPPGQGWISEPFPSFITVPLAVVAIASGVLPGLWLVFRVRRQSRPEDAVARAPRSRLARAAVAASLVILALAIAGWIDSATWHLQSLTVGRDRYVHLVSMYGECELILMVDWNQPDAATLADLTPWELRHRPTLRWSREPWLAPEYRGHHTPDRLQLFPWFSGDLHDGDDLDDGVGLFGGPTTLTSDGPSDDAAAPAAQPSPVTGFTVEIPYWFVVLLAAVLPAVATLRALRARRRGRAGRCTHCGYDLRATPGRCPECGTGSSEATC